MPVYRGDDTWKVAALRTISSGFCSVYSVYSVVQSLPLKLLETLKTVVFPHLGSPALKGVYLPRSLASYRIQGRGRSPKWKTQSSLIARPPLRPGALAPLRSILNRRGFRQIDEFNAKAQRCQDAKGESWSLGPTGLPTFAQLANILGVSRTKCVSHTSPRFCLPPRKTLTLWRGTPILGPLWIA